MERQITISEVATAAAEALRHDSYHCYPGVVQSYDATQETCNVQPGTNDVRIDLDSGARISEPFQVLQGVPVAWPRFGGFVIKGSLAQYDPVLLLAFDLDPTPWRQAGRTLKPVDPGDIRRHGGGYWFALPTNLLLGHPQASAPTGTLTIGAEGQAPVIEITGSSISLGSEPTAAVALATQIDAFITACVQAVTGIPPGPGAAAALAAAVLAFSTTPPGWTAASTTGAKIVKGQ